MACSRRRIERDQVVRNAGVAFLFLGALGMVFSFIAPSTGDAGLVRHGMDGISNLLLALSFACFGVYINMGSDRRFSISALLVNALFIGLTGLCLFIAFTTLSDVAGDVQDGPKGVCVASYEEVLDRNGGGRVSSFTPDEYEVDLFERLGDDVPVAHISVKRSEWPKVLSELTSAEVGSKVLFYPRTQVFLGIEKE